MKAARRILASAAAMAIAAPAMAQETLRIQAHYAPEQTSGQLSSLSSHTADGNLTSRNPPAGVVDYAFAAGAVTALVLGARSAFL